MEIEVENRGRRYRRNLRLKIIELFGGCCEKCKSKEQLEFAHKIGFRLAQGEGRGKKRRCLEVKKNPERFNLFCKKCHYWYDKSNPLIEEEKVPF